MTVWAAGLGKYSDEVRFRTITAREFVRRFRHAVTRRETNFVWLLGAGCSVSSGIPSASEAVQGWIKELKYLETGQDRELDAWASKRFVGYSADDPAAVYGEVMQSLFYTEQDRRKELERLMKVAEPGFGYATLAQLMTHEKWGARTSVSISMNFDDLAADALHLYSQKRPQVFTQESFTGGAPLTPNAPAVIKLMGDAHLPSAGVGNRPQFKSDVRDRVREVVSDAGLILIGYGGRDESLLDLLEGLPAGQPSGGVFWINDTLPPGDFGDWLHDRGAVWVEHADFDELMYFVRMEFGLGHPKIERFERILRKYEAQYRELSTRSGLGISETGATAPDLTLQAPTTLTRRETDESRRQRLKESLKAFSDAVATPAAGEVDPQLGPVGDKNALIEDSFREIYGDMPDGGRAAPPPAETVADVPSKVEPSLVDPVETRAPTPSAAPSRPAAETRRTAAPRRDPAPAAVASAPPAAPEPAQTAEELLNRAAALRSAPMETPAPAPAPVVEPTPAPAPIAAESAAARGERLQAAAAARPGDADAQADYARYLASEVRDAAAAEAAFEAALKLTPDDVPLLREYATFSLKQLQDARRAEGLLTRALNRDLRNAETLHALADFLIRARGDLEEAENCYRLAIEVEPDGPRNLIAYAHFLEERRGRRDAAEAYLRRAAEMQPRSAAALSELALFRALRAKNFDAADQLLEEALTLESDAPEVALAAAAIAERKGDLDGAEAAYEKAVARAPKRLRAQLDFARFLLVRRRDADRAEERHMAAIDAAPDDAEPRSALAVFLDDVREDSVGSEQRHREAIEREPFSPIALAAFAEHLGRRPEMLDEADALFREALKLSPRATLVLRAYGRFLSTCRNDAEAAETYLRRAVEIEPHSVEALDDLAQFLNVVRKDPEEAEIYFREALRLAPDRGETLSRFAKFLRESSGDPRQAERSYRRAMERNPKDAATLSRAAQFLLAEGRVGEGLKLLNDAFDAAWCMDPAVRPPWLMLELWICRYAHDAARRPEALKAARGLIEAGVRCDGSEIEQTVERAAAEHPEPDLLRRLSRVATDGADPSVLRQRSA